MALAFYVAFIPHQAYPYPVHLDEWQNLANFQALITAGSITFPDPYLGGAVPQTPNAEIGFHVIWATFHQISGIPWLTIFRYFPGVIFMITVLSVYILVRREGSGWEAALFTALIPTTVGILGPAFLVPVAMGLPFIALSLFIAFNFRQWWSYGILFLFTCLLLAMHAATAVGLVLILAPYVLLNLKGNFKHSLGITLAVAIPFMGLIPYIFNLVLPMARSLFTPLYLPNVDIPFVIPTYGYLPVLLCLAGAIVLAVRGGKKSYGLIFGLLTLLLMLTVRYTFHYGTPIMYVRGLIYAMLMMSIVAGFGLAWVKNIRLPVGLMDRLKTPTITRNVGYILCLILVGLTLYIAIPARQNTPYYNMIDGEDYEVFMWIKENVDSSYSKAILDPWKATALTAITGKNVYSRIGEIPRPSDIEAYNFLKSGSANTTFLRENGLSIVYTRVYDGMQNVEYISDNPDLTEVRKYVYLLKED
jgi:hypothetical protein